MDRDRQRILLEEYACQGHTKIECNMKPWFT